MANNEELVVTDSTPAEQHHIAKSCERRPFRHGQLKGAFDSFFDLLVPLIARAHLRQAGAGAIDTQLRADDSTCQRGCLRSTSTLFIVRTADG